MTVVTHLPPTSEIGVQKLTQPQVGKLGPISQRDLSPDLDFLSTEC